MKKYYRQFDHTSDLGVEVEGEDLKKLFANGALCLTDLIAGRASIKPEIKQTIRVRAGDRELLLREFLAETLYRFHKNKFLPVKVEISRLNDKELVAILVGDHLDIKRHPVKREIKSVTFHQLKIENQNRRFKARFVMDI